MKQPFTFTQADRDSPLWRRLEEHMRERRDTLRAQNDTPKPEQDTALLRGRIAELTTLLDLARERQGTRTPIFPAAG